MFKSVKINPFARNEDEKPRSGGFGYFARSAPAGTGFGMIIAQSLNQGMRHCRIGLVTLKQPDKAV